MPTRIVDLHTHVFNARYLPLAGIIADVIGKDSSRLADLVARLLYRLTDSDHEPDALEFVRKRLDASPDADPYVDAIWSITEHELLAAMAVQERVADAKGNLWSVPLDSVPSERMESSDLMQIVRELDALDYAEEGW